MNSKWSLSITHFCFLKWPTIWLYRMVITTTCYITRQYSCALDCLLKQVTTTAIWQTSSVNSSSTGLPSMVLLPLRRELMVVRGISAASLPSWSKTDSLSLSVVYLVFFDSGSVSTLPLSGDRASEFKSGKLKSFLCLFIHVAISINKN